MAKQLHPEVAKAKMPQLRRNGQTIKGPEPVGCMNSGFRPMIVRRWTISGKPDAYYVGYETEIDDLHEDRLRAARAGRKMPISRKRGDKFGARLYKSASAARAKFLELVSDRLYENEATREEYRRAREQARSKNPETAIAGALRLADF